MLLSQALRIRRKETVAFVGAGGKTTAMFRLADELVAAGWRVVVTTTTKLYTAQAKAAPRWLHAPELDALLHALPDQLRSGSPLFVSRTAPVGAKTTGIPLEWVAPIIALPDVDALLIEADGARGRLLKAPAPHEPVIPTCTTLVVPVIGIDVVGHTLNPDRVHRIQQVVHLTGLRPGDVVTPTAVATVLGHPQGGCKNVPPGARVVPLVNRVAGLALLLAAQEIAEQTLKHARIAGVCLGNVEADDPVQEIHERVAGIVLAAGGSARFGGTVVKQLLPWGGNTLVGHVVARAQGANLTPIVVVTGRAMDRVQAAVAPRRVHIVHNPHWRHGQSSSIRIGLQALAYQPPVGAAIFILADQPRISPELIQALIERHSRTLASIVVPVHAGQRGNPVLFDHDLFEDLMALKGDVGGRVLMNRYADQVEELPWPEDVSQDIDTPDDYARALGQE
ncbi:MAG TPA: putative selenium-dependent hydroxylase accessory protein YqeC [Anaerolineae bacterium]|nr:putative selenium-dependent hydroxylase accessory protein YqeC [Anaerolineae bacterium]HIQ05581.1 putative selenium-dependent hydroxylase accessory protein YqeC [Anaerolineae bacterium]